MDTYTYVVVQILLCQLCVQQAMTAWYLADLMQHKKAGQNFSMHCDGATVGFLNDPYTIVSRLELYKNATRVFSCTHGKHPIQQPEISHWNVRCDGLESSTSIVPNGDTFNMTVTIPSLTVADENIYACRVTHHLERAPGTVQTILKSTVKLYVRDVPEKSPCDTGWIHFRQKNSCLLFMEGEVSMGRGRDFCAIHFEGHLVIIPNEDFDAYLTSVTSSPNDIVSFWIGLTDEREENTFEWMDGTNLTYSNWEVGHPRNDISSNCVVQGLTPSGKWTDVSCGEQHIIICEVDLKDDRKGEDKQVTREVVIVSFIFLTVSVLVVVCLLMALPQGLLDSVFGGEEARNSKKTSGGDSVKSEPYGGQVVFESRYEADSQSETLDPPLHAPAPVSDQRQATSRTPASTQKRLSVSIPAQTQPSSAFTPTPASVQKQPFTSTPAPTFTQKPASISTPAHKQPSISTPAHRLSPVSTSASTQRPASISTPTQKQPSISTPTQKQPSISTPTQKQPSISTPTQKQPSISTPTQKQPSISTPAQKQPSISTPAPAPLPSTSTPASTQKQASVSIPSHKQAFISTPAPAQKPGSISPQGSISTPPPAQKQASVSTPAQRQRRITGMFNRRIVKR